MDDESTTERPAKRQRASRAGQAKRFECQHAGCGKRYSRAEHLHRHELNHKPKEVFRCEEPHCGHTFVRPDLFARHKARHEALLSTRPSDHVAASDGAIDSAHAEHVANKNDGPARTDVGDHARSASNVPPTTISTTAAANRPGESLSMTLGSLDSQNSDSPQLQSAGAAFVNDDAGQTNDNFAAWLFESPGSHYDDFNLTNLSFLDFGLEYSPKDTWNLDAPAFNNEQPGSIGRPNAQSVSGATPGSDASHDRGAISEQRHAEITSLISLFLWKQRGQRGNITQDANHVLFSNDGQNFPNLTAAVLDNLMANFWLGSRQVPFIHQPTFSNNSCNVLLLLAMVALGASGLARSKPKGSLYEYKELGDLIITNLRWEIFTDNDAQPPVQLWAAQALLLVEFYEKQCSTRKLHERAHIHHASTLTLLRRGSPLVGRSGSESPSSEMPSRYGSPVNNGETFQRHTSSHENSWWIHWVRNESFNRVVFTAFQMDTLHAVMFGHAADMAANEIRLCMPCDDSLWKATSAAEVQRLEANMKMYGIRPVNFLDGLKRSLHAHEVHTHAPARILLMAGLLSVGWHISRREKHLQFLETVPSMREQGRWRSLLLHAFGHWRTSFEQAAGAKTGDGDGAQSPDMNAAAPAVLFHLAHMTMHADIIDIQIYSGSKRLLGRKVSRKDYLNVVQRVKSWAATPVARHAVLHAMKLLHESLLKPNLRTSRPIEQATKTIRYNTRTDPLFYRPWGLYLSALIVFSYQHARRLYITHSASALAQQQWANDGLDDQARCCQYLTLCAAIDDPGQLSQILTVQGCASMLSVLSQNFSKADPELLIEASKRLQECRSMILMNDSASTHLSSSWTTAE